ncbi:RING-H2 finger protein ATL66-like [Chenopodium quinoa]|uniref:RING-H2 finger protein ATL66-like n=1 Tax=Chenopodium quinoa TaxID=63459 RepID=UPI000B787DAA|nr:RING-H2 finger protein ATL66-like [Chenopodium quinoa]
MSSRRLLNHLSQLTTDENSRLLHWHYSEFDDHNFQIHGQTLFYLFILFSIILVVTLLLLYARWYFRFRHAHHAHYHNSQAHASHASANPAVCHGLDPMVIKTMPILLHQRSSVGREDEMECCICLGVFEDGDKVKVLPKCDHRFHSDCVDRWLCTQSSCPLCRLSFRVDPPSDPSVILAV